jgi:histidine triad (HIT) family protein
MDNCLFCKIIKGEIPSEKLYEDDDILAFKDIAPQAPVHFLVIPKKHIVNQTEIQPEDEKIIGKLLKVAAIVAEEQGIGKGFRSVINNGADAGQVVFHIHMHVLGGRALEWPPG